MELASELEVGTAVEIEVSAVAVASAVGTAVGIAVAVGISGGFAVGYFDGGVIVNGTAVWIMVGIAV